MIRDPGCSVLDSMNHLFSRHGSFDFYCRMLKGSRINPNLMQFGKFYDSRRQSSKQEFISIPESAMGHHFGKQLTIQSRGDSYCVFSNVAVVGANICIGIKCLWWLQHIN